MLNLPPIIIDLLNPFAPCFYGVTTWMKAQILLIGTILTTGKRMVTAALRVMGLQDEMKYVQYHQVLNRVVWNSLDLAQVLLGLLAQAFCGPDEPLVLGIDETIERRCGHKIAARGIYRDPARSHFVKTSGLRWNSLLLLDRAPWHFGDDMRHLFDDIDRLHLLFFPPACPDLTCLGAGSRRVQSQSYLSSF